MNREVGSAWIPISVLACSVRAGVPTGSERGESSGGSRLWRGGRLLWVPQGATPGAALRSALGIEMHPPTMEEITGIQPRGKLRLSPKTARRRF